MSTARVAAVVTIAALLLTPLTPALAQDAPAPAAPTATTVAEPAIATDILTIKLRPLTKGQLELEVAAWMALLQAKAQDIANAEGVSKTADGGERDVLLGALPTLRGEQTALIDRVTAVLDAYEAKGGDVTEHELYITAVTGFSFDATDYEAAYATAWGWAKDPQGGLRLLKNFVFFLLTLLVFRIIASIVGRIAARALASPRIKTSELLRDFFVNTIRKVVFFIGFVVALSALEVDIGPFLAAIGAISFVIAFALQGTLSNFACGVMILLYRPYDIGHVVEVGGVTGKVDAMTLVSTTLRTPDNQLVIVPNGAIWGGVIRNITGVDKRRVDLVFGIGYGDDIAKAHAVMEEVVANHPMVLKDPEPVIKVHELADSSVNFVCRPWCASGDYWDVYWDLTRSVKEKFDEAGVSIPFPQTDVHVHQVVANGNGNGGGSTAEAADAGRLVASKD